MYLRLMIDNLNKKVLVLNQSYENWEIIFWDNRSTDNSKNILNSFKDRRIKYFFVYIDPSILSDTPGQG